MAKETIWNILQKAEEIQLEISELEDRRDEELLKLRGLRLSKNQKQFIQTFDGYIAYELIEGDD